LRAADADVDSVHGAVVVRRRKADQVLTVQLLRNPRERRPEMLGVLEFDVAAARLAGQAPQSRVGLGVAGAFDSVPVIFPY